MKEIKALIQPHRLESVLEELHAHPRLPGVTVSEVRGFGRTVGRTGSQPGINNPIYGTVNMAKLECVVDDELLDEIVEVITKAAHTGLPGDGKVVIYDVNEMVKIRTGERSDRVT